MEHDSRPFCFLVRDPNCTTVKAAKRRDDGALENATHENFLLSAESEAEQNGWIKSLRLNIDKNPFYALIKTKVSAVDVGGAPSPSFAGRPLEASALSINNAQEQSSTASPRKSLPQTETTEIESHHAAKRSSRDETDLFGIGKNSESDSDDDRSIGFETEQEVSLEAVDSADRLSFALLGKRPPPKTPSASPEKRSRSTAQNTPQKEGVQLSSNRLLPPGASENSDEESLDNVGV